MTHIPIFNINYKCGGGGGGGGGGSSGSGVGGWLGFFIWIVQLFSNQRK